MPRQPFCFTGPHPCERQEFHEICAGFRESPAGAANARNPFPELGSIRKSIGKISLANSHPLQVGGRVAVPDPLRDGEGKQFPRVCQGVVEARGRKTVPQPPCPVLALFGSDATKLGIVESLIDGSFLRAARRSVIASAPVILSPSGLSGAVSSRCAKFLSSFASSGRATLLTVVSRLRQVFLLPLERRA